MKTKTLKIISYIYLIIPIMIFILGWVKLKIAFISVILLTIILLKKILEKEENDEFISKRYFFILFGIVFFICIIAGIGGLYYQSIDWDYRNAIFRDLINKEWPVYYEQNDALLVYYVGIWMVPAMIRKIFFNIFGRNYCLESC